MGSRGRLDSASRRYPPPESRAFLTRQLLHHLGVTCVLDVGAHKGEFARFLRHDVAFRGLIVSFEPTPSTFSELRAAFSDDPDWKGYRYALGDKSGSATLHVMAASAFNSLLRPSALASDDFPEPMREVRSDEVEVRRLDEVLDSIIGSDKGRLFLKVDAQGADLAIIEGASGVHSRIAAVQAEVPVLPIYEGAPLLPRFVQRMSELGFELAGAFPVTSIRFRVVDMDCMFVNSAVTESLSRSPGVVRHLG